MPRIRFFGRGCIPVAAVELNMDHAHGLGLPGLRGAGADALAVVAGGPSVSAHVHELNAWAGDIWAVNGAFQWLRRHGIASTFFSVDPIPDVAGYAEGADKAILASCCDPSVFRALKDAEVRVFDIGPKGMMAGPTSAATTPRAAIEAGYSSVTLWGCESSYDAEITHAYEDKPVPWLMRVKCGEEEFLTEPEFALQAEVLSAIIRAAPAVFSERSGGLLSAMVAHGDYEITHISKELQDTMRAA